VFHVKSHPALAALCDRHGLGDAQCRQLQAILAELEGDAHAPTTVRDPAGALDVHLADSLAAVDVEPVGSARVAADLGAGAGFPGLALAVALPGARLRLVESQVRKCGFIERLATAAGIANVTVVHARAEEWREGIGANDLVVARAVAAQPVVLEYAAPLLGLGGTLVDWRGRRNREEEETSLRAAAELGLDLAEIRHVQPYAAARDRHLHVFVKSRPTPPRFPRRPGVARKRPLGAARSPR
jgi:16S rRNA (guanine527-N7)-methyltransferase